MIEDRTKRLNFIRRVFAEIEGNAKKATPGPWAISHGVVIKHDLGVLPDGSVRDVSFDIAYQPHLEGQAHFGVNPHASGWNDMRYIATVDPKTMLALIENLRAEIAELRNA
jgi:hypothetical protein